MKCLTLTIFSVYRAFLPFCRAEQFLRIDDSLRALFEPSRLVRWLYKFKAFVKNRRWKRNLRRWWRRSVDAPGLVLIFWNYSLKLWKIFKYFFTNFKTKKVIKIKKTHPYYATINDFNYYYNSQTGLSICDDGAIKMQLVNELATNMSYETWYLLPQAHSLKLTRI